MNNEEMIKSHRRYVDSDRIRGVDRDDLMSGLALIEMPGWTATGHWSIRTDLLGPDDFPGAHPTKWDKSKMGKIFAGVDFLNLEELKKTDVFRFDSLIPGCDRLQMIRLCEGKGSSAYRCLREDYIQFGTHSGLKMWADTEWLGPVVLSEQKPSGPDDVSVVVTPFRDGHLRAVRDSQIYHDFLHRFFTVYQGPWELAGDDIRASNGNELLYALGDQREELIGTANRAYEAMMRANKELS